MAMKWSHHDSYATPEWLLTALEREFGIDLDPCPLQPNFDPAIHTDGLALDWTGRIVFCNPPWSDISPWIRKALASRCTTVFVLPARTDTEWFHLLKDSGAELRFWRKRASFLKNGDPGAVGAATDGTLIAIVRRMAIN